MTNCFIRNRRTVLASLCCVLAMLPTALIAGTPGSVLNKLAVPDNATLEIVTTDALHNGAPIAMATLTSPESADSVLAFYRNLWNDGDEKLPGHIESAYDNHQLISRLQDGMNIVIQFEKNSDEIASGFVSVLALNAPRVTEDHGAFSDLESLSSNRSVDGADTSWIRVYASPSSGSRTHKIYLKRLTAIGWHVLADNEVEGAWVTQLGRDNMRLEVSFLESREFASVVVAHQVVSK